MYRIQKAGTWLADIGSWWNTWIDDVSRAKVFYDKTLADSIAQTLDASVIAVQVLN